MKGRRAPTGTVAFLFTDIEGSTRAWQADPAAMGEAVAAHDRLVRSCIEDAGGYVFALGGDSFAAAFQTVDAAVDAAVCAQESLAAHPWPTPRPLRVRMGIHAGSAQERDENYFGPTVNRAARLMSAGHGGQILLSGVSASLSQTGRAIRSLGERRLADVEGAEHVHQIGDGRFPPLRAVEVFRCDVPAARTELFGREEDLLVIDRSLRSSPLVTLVGVGGAGKTRLAFEAARAMQIRFQGGVRLVDLTVIASPGDVAPSIATAVDLMPEADTVDAIARAIGGRDVLLVVDNCEHVIDAVADCVDALLAACPNLVVLATSREPLEVDGESVYPVPPLDPAGAAIELFRARVEATGLDPDQFDPSDVADLCARLDGLPLAVELAAARARTLQPTELIARLDAGAELGSGRRRGRRRHDTLDATIAWSYNLLDDEERLVLRRSALFETDFPLEGIESTSGLSPAAVVDALDGLVAKSLVVRVPAPGRNETSWYRLLDTIREFAARRLTDDDDLEHAQNRLVDYVVGLFDAWLTGTRRPQLLLELLTQRATIAAAARHAEAGRRLDAVGDLLHLSSLVWWCEPTTADPDDLIHPDTLDELPDDIRGSLIALRATRHLGRGDIDACLQTVGQALQLSATRDTHYGATALSIQSRLISYIDPEAGLEMANRAVAMWERAEPAPRAPALAGDFGSMFLAQDHASTLLAVDDHQAAWEELLNAARLGPDVNPIAHIGLLADLIWVSLLIDRPADGLAHVEAALGTDLGASLRWSAAQVHLSVARACAIAAAGDPERAERILLATIESSTAFAPGHLSAWLVAFGVIAFHAGDHERAHRLLRAPTRAGMGVMMARRRYLAKLGTAPSSTAVLESADDADIDVDEITAIIDEEIRHVRHTLTER